MLRRMLMAIALSMALMTSISARAIPVTQLGFALDASGSVAASDYNLLRSGLSAALAGLPLDGSVEVSIVSYGSGVLTVVAPTLLSMGTLSNIQNAIATHIKDNGGTDTAAAITGLTSLLTGSSFFSDPGTRSIINLATDGFPNSQTAAEAAGAAAFAAGIDALSIEAIGDGVSSAAALNNLAAIAFPDNVAILAVNSTAIPNPLNGSFVVPVSDFKSLAPVLAAKVQASVTPPVANVPEPASLALLLLGMIGIAIMRRRGTARMSLAMV